MNYINFFMAYFLGSIPFGLIFTKCFLGLDIRNFGSGNIGATNVYRTGNKFVAVLTLLMDCFKGLLVIYFARKTGLSNYEINLCGFLCILGHIYPVWLKFKGGKGVATSFAIILTVEPYVGLSVIFIWIIVFLYKRISSLSSIITFIALPLVAIILDISFSNKIMFVIVSVFILIKHVDNLKRLYQGKEKQL